MLFPRPPPFVPTSSTRPTRPLIAAPIRARSRSLERSCHPLVRPTRARPRPLERRPADRWRAVPRTSAQAGPLVAHGPRGLLCKPGHWWRTVPLAPAQAGHPSATPLIRGAVTGALPTRAGRRSPGEPAPPAGARPRSCVRTPSSSAAVSADAQQAVCEQPSPRARLGAGDDHVREVQRRPGDGVEHEDDEHRRQVGPGGAASSSTSAPAAGHAVRAAPPPAPSRCTLCPAPGRALRPLPRYSTGAASVLDRGASVFDGGHPQPSEMPAAFPRLLLPSGHAIPVHTGRPTRASLDRYAPHVIGPHRR